MRALLATAALLAACNPDPGHPDQQVGYRDGLDGGANSGERGTIRITEILWSGTVRGEGDEAVWDPTDVFIELRNESARPVNLSGWFLDIEGVVARTLRIPDSDVRVEVGKEVTIAAKSTGCLIDPTWVLPDLELPQGDPFRLTLRDRDERLMEPAGSREMPPYAGGYDLVTSRSMERINLMFGGQGTEPESWHYYNERRCPNAVIEADPEANVGLNCFEDIPNNDLVRPECRAHTLASPGRANSPDYSGAQANGGFD